MAVCTQQIEGLSHDIADVGIPIASVPIISGSKGIVTIFSINWGGRDLPPLDAAISIQGAPFPGGSGAFAVGTDSNGSIGVTGSGNLFPPDYNPTEFSTSAGTLVLVDGFWGSDIRAFINDSTGTRRFTIETLSLALTDLVETLNDVPENVQITRVEPNPVVDGETETDLTWTYDNLGEDPHGFTVIRDGEIIGTVPFETGEDEYTYTDYLEEDGTYTYTIRTYKLTGLDGGSTSPPSDPPIIVTTGDSLIIYSAEMTLAFEWNSVMAFIVDPSGIYGLIPNKTHDTLYNRGEEDSVDVKIPDPFVKLAFIPEE